ncbi:MULTISPECIES: sigma factor-binding protein Crl [Aliagarivorans]|uniref:sigma factor-binding protein Crl n=1 Tax=Aliagarivorans TaxID=882379 RepID=UPI00041E91DB|nr:MULTISPECIES: sigma factor-binding protein Crl [Aliagarivorans]
MDVKWPTHGKLVKKFTELGPYLRGEQSSKECYFFDCLAACVSAKPAAEVREFYGWWMQLVVTEQGFEYNYTWGIYNEKGDWDECAIPKKHQEEVTKSLDVFYQKLLNLLDELSLPIEASASLSPSQALPAA